MRHRISRSHTPRVQDFSHRRLLVLEKRDVGEAGYLDKSQVRELELGYDGEGEKGQRHEWVVQPRSHGPCQGLQQPSFYAPPQRSADLEPGDRSGRIAISPPASPPPSLRRLCAAGHPPRLSRNRGSPMAMLLRICRTRLQSSLLLARNPRQTGSPGPVGYIAVEYCALRCRVQVGDDMAAFDFRMKQQFFGAQGPSRTPITDFPALGRDHESSELRRVIRIGLPGLAGAGPERFGKCFPMRAISIPP